MLSMLRRRLTFANLVALLALFVALGGSSYAALRVGSRQIADNSVRSRDLRNNDVRGRDIRQRTIRGGDLAPDALTGAQIQESRLGTVPNAARAGQAARAAYAASAGHAISAGKAAAAGNAATLGGNGPAAFLAASRLSSKGLVKLNYDETKTLASSGPFTWKATCRLPAAPGESSRVEVVVESRVPDAIAFRNSGDGPNLENAPLMIGPGQPPGVVFKSEDVKVYPDSGPPTPLPGTPLYGFGFLIGTAAPSGAGTYGVGGVALNGAFGAPCAVSISLLV